jgi:DNA-binding MarR family transcriptional regulator
VTPAKKEAPTSGDVQSFVEALDAAQHVLRSIADEALGELGESRLIDLADALSIAPSTATRLCDTLADRQLIVRHRRGRDRRELQIKLTDAGTRLLAAVRTRTAAGWEETLGRIGADERRKVALVLRRLAESKGAPEATGLSA